MAQRIQGIKGSVQTIIQEKIYINENVFSTDFFGPKASKVAIFSLTNSYNQTYGGLNTQFNQCNHETKTYYIYLFSSMNEMYPCELYQGRLQWLI